MPSPKPPVLLKGTTCLHGSACVRTTIARVQQIEIDAEKYGDQPKQRRRAALLCNVSVRVCDTVPLPCVQFRLYGHLVAGNSLRKRIIAR
eukprot:317321-Pelagomonas_calceolata.AAC.1